MIAAAEGRSIPEIFRTDGETRFRQLEADALESLKLKTGEVIATGGGTPCREGRMEILRHLGTVVWLDGDVRELYARARALGNRPMLEGRTMAEIEELYRSRQPYYRRAHLTIDTTGIGADQVVARILSALREAHAVRA
jgi:shikimate kinase